MWKAQRYKSEIWYEDNKWTDVFRDVRKVLLKIQTKSSLMYPCSEFRKAVDFVQLVFKNRIFKFGFHKVLN